MSGVASDAAVEAEEGAPVESAADVGETWIAYDPNSNVPLVVIGVWICALVGLGIYCVTYYLPDLSRWTH